MRDERFVDANNMCWFWWCVINEDTGEFSLLPKRCALGTTINYHFTGGVSNPCTEYGKYTLQATVCTQAPYRMHRSAKFGQWSHRPHTACIDLLSMANGVTGPIPHG